MTRHLFAFVLGPLFGVFFVSIGNGFLSSITSLRLDSAGVSDTMIGAISSSYFIGLTLGAVFSDRLIIRIGHIRAYSSFASLSAVTFLLQGLLFDPLAWLFFRLLNGWAIVGIFLVVESWLLMAGDQKIRGRLLAVYMIIFYGSGMLGQLKLGAINAMGETAPFMIAGLLASLSVLPMVVLPKISPDVSNIKPLLPRSLLQLTPTGVVGCFGSGVTIAAVYALLPIYLQRVGMDVAQVGLLMACTILGAMLLQYPVGRWSDRSDRQFVLIILGILCTALSLLIVVLPDMPRLLMVLLFLLGGGTFAIYPVSISHSSDRAKADELVQVIQGLLLINSIGSAISPVSISAVMSQVGDNGFFWAFAFINAAMTVFFISRRGARPAPTHVAPFAAAAQMSPLGAEIRVTEELEQAAVDRENQAEGLLDTPTPVDATDAAQTVASPTDITASQKPAEDVKK